MSIDGRGIAFACRPESGLTGQQAVLQSDVAAPLMRILASGSPHAQREVAYTFANLLAGHHSFTALWDQQCAAHAAFLCA